MKDQKRDKLVLWAVMILGLLIWPSNHDFSRYSLIGSCLSVARKLEVDSFTFGAILFLVPGALIGFAAGYWNRSNSCWTLGLAQFLPVCLLNLLWYSQMKGPVFFGGLESLIYFFPASVSVLCCYAGRSLFAFLSTA
jgi:hypothetical protein